MYIFKLLLSTFRNASSWDSGNNIVYAIEKALAKFQEPEIRASLAHVDHLIKVITYFDSFLEEAIPKNGYYRFNGFEFEFSTAPFGYSLVPPLPSGTFLFLSQALLELEHLSDRVVIRNQTIICTTLEGHRVLIQKEK